MVRFECVVCVRHCCCGSVFVWVGAAVMRFGYSVCVGWCGLMWGVVGVKQFLYGKVLLWCVMVAVSVWDGEA